MKLHHSFADTVFHRDQDGLLLFMPYGSLGAAYVVRDDDNRDRIHRAIGYYVIVGFLIAVASAFFNDFAVLGAILAVLLFAYALLTRILTRALVRHTAPLNLVEQPHRKSGPMPGVTWRDMRLACSLFLVMALIVLVGNPAEWPMAVAGIAFFGWGLLSTFIGR
jgi:hypothetical protein